MTQVHTFPPHPNTKLKMKKPSEMEVQIWKNQYITQDKLKRAQKRMCPLALMFRANQDQDIIQISNNMKPL